MIVLCVLISHNIHAFFLATVLAGFCASALQARMRVGVIARARAGVSDPQAIRQVASPRADAVGPSKKESEKSVMGNFHSHHHHQTHSYNGHGGGAAGTLFNGGGPRARRSDSSRDSRDSFAEETISKEEMETRFSRLVVGPYSTPHEALQQFC